MLQAPASKRRPRRSGWRFSAILTLLALLVGPAAGQEPPAKGEKKEKERKGPSALPPAEQLAYFAKAVAEDEKRDLKKLLENNPAFFGYRDEAGRTALFALPAIEDPEILDVIFTYATQLDVADAGGKTPLILAVEKSKLPIVERLLDKGADAKVGDPQKRGPLTYAALGGKLEIARALLLRSAEEGRAADPTAADQTGATPLHYAAAGGFHQFAQLLLDHGADPNARDRQGNTPLALAEKRKHTLVVRLLKRSGATG